jgi:quercetin dioxygenase-like cupin family protein
MNDIDARKTLGELVTEHPSLATVFDGLGLDYCCGPTSSVQTPIAVLCAEARSTDTEIGRVVTVTDLGALPTWGGDGVVWSLPHGGDLDANLVRLGPDAAIGEHRNDEVDVLVYVQSGTGELVGDGRVQRLSGQVAALIPRGSRRSIRAGTRGLTYLSIHRRRDGLALKQHADAES